jgi:hypothetical protein
MRSLFAVTLGLIAFTAAGQTAPVHATLLSNQGDLHAGASVEVETCTGAACSTSIGMVPICALGGLAQSAAVRATRHANVMRRLSVGQAETEVAVQGVEGLEFNFGCWPPSPGAVQPHAVRLGIVGITHVLEPTAAVRNDEEVLALCVDGPRRLPAHVRVGAPQRDGAVIVELTVDCRADVVIAGLPRTTQSGLTARVGDGAIPWSGARLFEGSSLKGEAIHAGDYDGDGVTDRVQLTFLARPTNARSMVVLVWGDGTLGAILPLAP